MEARTVNFVELTTERFNGLSGDTATLYDVANFIKDLHAEWTKDHEKELNDFIIEISRLREREKELVEALREAVPIVKESISEYQRLMDVETFQEAAWAMNQVKEQTEQTLAKIESLLSKFEV